MKKAIISLLIFFSFFVIISCSDNNNTSTDTAFIDISGTEDNSLLDTLAIDTDLDAGHIDKDRYFAVSFEENTIGFYDRENISDEPFISIATGGEISSIEYIFDKGYVVYSDLQSKEIIFLKDFKEIKRIGNVGEYPYSIKYIPKIKQMAIPDKNSNRIYIIDIEKMDFSSISPMTAGGNNPVSICFDETPLTQELSVRLFILDYGSLYVRAYDIFDAENWALRSEKLPTLSEPLNIACDSINRRLLVVNSGSNNISASGLDDMVQILNSPFEAGKNPTFAAIHSGASIAYVTNTSDDSLTIFSTKEMKAKGGISFKSGDRPIRVYVNEGEQRLYVLLSGAKSLLIYNIEEPLIPEKVSQIKFKQTPKELIFK